MSATFHPLRVSSIDKSVADAVTITFDVPEALAPVFQYKHGQYIAIRMVIDGVEHRRTYSLSSSPYHNEPLTIGVRKLADGVVSSWIADQLYVGAIVDVYPPMGNFTRELDPSHSRHYAFFGGGSGITPLMSILKSALRVEPLSRCTLFYANRSIHTTMFRTEIDALAAAFPSALRVVNVLEDTQGASQSSLAGRLDQATIEQLLDENSPVDEYFVCGPTGMMENVFAVLERRGVDRHHIHREYFTSPTSSQQQPPSNTMNDTAPESELDNAVTTRNVTIRLYGQQYTFAVEPDETILTAAQRANADPPYACQIGACCTCRAKLVSGKVRMDEREALSDDEIADGYILTCQSHPLTDDCVADYDL